MLQTEIMSDCFFYAVFEYWINTILIKYNTTFITLVCAIEMKSRESSEKSKWVL